MIDNELEMRLQENEGVLFGLMQAVALLVAHAKVDATFRATAADCLDKFEVVNINSSLPDFALEQARAVMQQLLQQPAPKSPEQAQSAE